MDVFSVFTPLLGHVAGVPVEETLPGVLAVAALSARVATEWVRRRLRVRPGRDTGDGQKGRSG